MLPVVEVAESVALWPTVTGATFATVTFGEGFTVTLVLAVFEQPVREAVTLYIVVCVGDTLI